MNIFSNFINSDLRTVVAASLYITLSVGTSVHILFYKDDIKSSIGWIALVFLSPFIGTMLYIFLGINRVRRKSIRLRKNMGLSEKYSEEMIKNIFESFPVNYKQFITFGHNTYHQNFVFGNYAEPLQNGVEAYPEMIKTIKMAKKEVLISSYIFDCDSETDKFLEALKIAIENGAEVKVLIDGIGTLKFFHRSIEKKLAKIKGLRYGIFLPPYIPVAMPFVNLRNHRKIMIIDGETAFFGGMNLSKKNILIDDLKNGILDLTFKIKGPVISQIYEVFECDWEFATGHKFESLYKNISTAQSEKLAARIIPDGPDNKDGIIELLVHGAINAAIKKILIVTPYFLPENNILTAVEMAAMKGVDIEIIIPEKSDYNFINRAVESNFLRLINCGVKIYKTPPPFDHSKILVVDDEWVFVGSANWDVRSFKLNFESNIEIFSKSLAEKLTAIAETKRENARLITATECKNFTFLQRIRNNACRLLTPYG
ncbi:MAG: phospholipase D-like domain-containing protein [Endomicrobium sp.]|uniref:phospholipase D-like domain-containing protein n=1 Tax=Candidatus Endomicrobiellum pyrsonymphae TaxID=1408203 RepID=UPI0035851ABA|nr:phospholipase D-like domain-containing protein [Endomicrobium sp.]